MASNTGGVTRSRSVRTYPDPSTPMSSADRYMEGGINNPSMDIGGNISPPSLVDQNSTIPGIANANDLMNIAGKTTQSYEISPSPKIDDDDTDNQGYTDELAQRKAGAALDATAGVLKAIGGVINANSKYSSVISQNNFNIQQAQTQALQLASVTHSRMLKEQTNGKARGQDALIAAVAQGQSAGGDLAQTAVSNEDVYAAENMMNLEINSMRQVFGLESQQRQLQASRQYRRN